MNRIKVDKRGFQEGFYCNCSDKRYLREFLPVKAKEGRCIWCKCYAVYGNYKHRAEIEISSDKYRKIKENNKIYFQNYRLDSSIKLEEANYDKMG